MKANPGGQLSPENIYGREELIASYWKTLDGQGIYVNDLRRIGKTQIMVKMHAERPPGWESVKADLGGCHTANEFATRAFRDSYDVLGAKNKTLRTMGKLMGSLAGTEIAGILKLPNGEDAPWKEVLSRTFADIEEQMVAMNTKMVFFWDEVPFLLDNIAQREGPKVAMEVLDVIRALSQDHNHVRLFLTGSIGLHHVLKDLQEKGYIGRPLNRMAHEQPGPLKTAHARRLAEDLLIGEGLDTINTAVIASHLAQETSSVPFYIHRLVAKLPRQETITTELIDSILTNELTSHEDDWDLSHYRERLDKYYGDKKSAALLALNAIALQQPASKNYIQNSISSSLQISEEELYNLLTLLCRDHYLTKDSNGEYRFYLDIIRRWWIIGQDLK